MPASSVRQSSDPRDLRATSLGRVLHGEYEAWFLAAARSLAGWRGLPIDLEPPQRPEGHATPQWWLGDRLPSGYVETLDQAALTAFMNLEEARRTSSFDKLVRDVARMLCRPAPPTGTPSP